MDLVYFIILVGVLIFVHELGHFAWAKFFGVKVLKFSLGFGRRLFGFRRGDTEYVVAAIPLGGYVQMLGENPNDIIGPGEEERAFHTQPLWRRVVIVVAGPAMNMVFPVVLYFVVFLGDGMLPPAIVGTVFPGQPADGKILPGDQIIAVDGIGVESFYDLNRIVSERPGEPLEFTIDRDGEQVSEEITPVLTHLRREPAELHLTESVGRVGISPYHPGAVIGVASPGSPAAAARMRTFDVVVSTGGRPIDRWLDLEAALDRNRGGTVPLTYLRPVRVEEALGGLVELDVYEPHVAALTPEPGSEAGASRAGLEPADLYVSHVTLNSPEHRVGMLPGDRLLTLDGRPVELWATFIEDLKVGRGRQHHLKWRRGDRVLSGTFGLRHLRGVNEYGQPYDRYQVGINNWVPSRVSPPIENPGPFTYALARALDSTWELTEVTVYSVVRLVQGRLSVRHIGGPLSVFQVAGTAAREGTHDYLRFMAFISINLGLINLLPIPLLDGGHLLFFLFEGVSRRRVSVKVRQYASLAGLSILILIMLLAFKNDLERQWPQIVDSITSE